jgi:hypothetical protein
VFLQKTNVKELVYSRLQSLVKMEPARVDHLIVVLSPSNVRHLSAANPIDAMTVFSLSNGRMTISQKIKGFRHYFNMAVLYSMWLWLQSRKLPKTLSLCRHFWPMVICALTYPLSKIFYTQNFDYNTIGRGKGLSTPNFIFGLRNVYINSKACCVICLSEERKVLATDILRIS